MTFETITDTAESQGTFPAEPAFVEAQDTQQWNDICAVADITPGVGVCALHQGEQVAIFVERISKQIYAVSNYDPIGKANVLSRGLTGCIKGQLVVASPLYKQHFALETGECLEQPEHRVKVYPVRICNGRVQLQLAADR